jgi:7,8-didemethyl-8-hydroxy-5-deazariboflavin synthase CofG subunit
MALCHQGAVRAPAASARRQRASASPVDWQQRRRERRRRLSAASPSTAATASSSADDHQQQQHWALSTPYDPTERQLVDRLLSTSLPALTAEARRLRAARDDAITAPIATFSPKVFLPLTRACRDACGYCTFAQAPAEGRRVYMTLDEVAEVARRGAQAGCTEALLTLGDRPEALYPRAAAELQELGGFSSTLEYVEAACARVLAETGLLPHVNAGLVDEAWARRLKRVSASQGLMLEGVDPALRLPGAAHDAATCPDKEPSRRLAAIEAAGKARVPFTSGVLVGIGESRAERLRALVALRRLHVRWEGFLQEVIVQNFVPKPGTAMEAWAATPLEELLWTVACARLVMPSEVSVQAPPNLTPSSSLDASSSASAASWRALLDAGIDDWGGISPGVTRDWVNPEKPWPHLAALAGATAEASGEEEEQGGRLLLPRLPVYPRFVVGQLPPAPGAVAAGRGKDPWLSEEGGAFSVAAAVRRHADAQGLSRGFGGWVAGLPDNAEEEAGGQALAEPVLQPPTPPSSSSPPTPSALLRPASGGLVLPTTSSSSSAWAVALDAYGGHLSGLPPPSSVSPGMRKLLERLLDPERDERERALAAGGGGQGAAVLTQNAVASLLTARGADAEAVRSAADALRRRVCGDEVTYVVNRNLNYTNVCTYGCTFCGFSKARPGEEDGEGGGGGASSSSSSLGRRDPPYLVPAEEVSRRAQEAWERGATEVCMQGGIHPDSTGETYLRLLRAAKRGAPDIHVHAFSPLEVWHGAETLGLPLEEFLRELRAAGLGSLPGTAAEILHDDVRDVICPDKLRTGQWEQVMEAAAMVARSEREEEEEEEVDRRDGGSPAAVQRRPPFRATATMMFGHVESPQHQAHHLLRLRDLQARTGGIFTEFVPLPFVSMGAPAYLRGHARRGPTLREAVLAHSAARLALHPLFTHIQASWVKMGPGRASAALLTAGCDDMGGTLMNESITRASGAAHGQELAPREMARLIRSVGGGGGQRLPRQRTTTYWGAPEAEQVARSLSDEGHRALQPVVKVAVLGAGGASLAAAGLV